VYVNKENMQQTFQSHNTIPDCISHGSYGVLDDFKLAFVKGNILAKLDDSKGPPEKKAKERKDVLYTYLSVDLSN
jgi:hypothetical protein